MFSFTQDKQFLLVCRWPFLTATSFINNPADRKGNKISQSEVVRPVHTSVRLSYCYANGFQMV